MVEWKERNPNPIMCKKPIWDQKKWLIQRNISNCKAKEGCKLQF